MKIDIIAGARPNFMKIAPIIKSIESFQKKGFDIEYRLIHTGQHYDTKMSENFFRELQLPKPNFNLEAGGGSQANQTAKIMIGYESILEKSSKIDLCIVVGDVTSTMACSIVAKKMNIKVAHIEAGIRSGDRTMPEEINRLITDSITDMFFTTSSFANHNLILNGVNKSNIFFVGNTMIDTLKYFQKYFKKPNIWNECKLQKKKYLVMTLHRPSNVDNKDNLNNLFQIISNQARGYKILFPAHPRISNSLNKNYIRKEYNIIVTDPLSYFKFNYLVKNTLAVITDSGGITEETTVLGIPCITLRNNTERPETIKYGTNILVGNDSEKIKKAFNNLFDGNWKKGKIPEKWDGKTAERIIKIILEHFN